MMVEKKYEEISNIFDNPRLAPRAVARALVILYNNQTTEEKYKSETIEKNNSGFAHHHAEIGTRCAKYFLRTGHLEDWMINFWMKRTGVRQYPRIMTYRRQLLEAIKNKG